METLEQLKAQAYDCIVQIEQWQIRLRETNQKISNFREGENPGKVVIQ